MKKKSLTFFVFLLFLARTAYGYTYAFSSEVAIELSSNKAEYALYEPVILRLKVTYLGNYSSKEINPNLERIVLGDYPFWASGPFKPDPYNEHYPIRQIGLVPLPSSEGTTSIVLLPGDSLIRDFWIYPNLGNSITASLGDYEIWIAPKGDWVQPNNRFESNHLKIKVVEPSGKEKEALDYAKSPGRLLTLMNRPISTGDNNAVKFCQGFVNKTEGSAYHPFALFALSREYLSGAAETRKKPTRRKDTFSREPDYELLLQSSDEFIRLYPEHPLADEVHLFRLVALYGLGKKDEATKEFDVIRERLAPLEKALWEQFRKNGSRAWSDEQATAEMEKGPLYVLSAAKEIKDIFENNLMNGRKRTTPYNFSYSEWPVQAKEAHGQFNSRWSPR